MEVRGAELSWRRRGEPAAQHKSLAAMAAERAARMVPRWMPQSDLLFVGALEERGVRGEGREGKGWWVCG